MGIAGHARRVLLTMMDGFNGYAGWGFVGHAERVLIVMLTVLDGNCRLYEKELFFVQGKNLTRFGKSCTHHIRFK